MFGTKTFNARDWHSSTCCALLLAPKLKMHLLLFVVVCCLFVVLKKKKKKKAEHKTGDVFLIFFCFSVRGSSGFLWLLAVLGVAAAGTERLFGFELWVWGGGGGFSSYF